MPLVSLALRRRLVLGLLPVAVLGSLAVLPASAEADDVVIRTLSGRADLVSGGDALVEITLPAGVDVPANGRLGAVRVLAGGRDHSDAFREHEGRYRGLVTDLPVGTSAVTVVVPDGRAARLTVTNAPIGGPVFSGPQIEPWTCAEGAQDEQCNREPSVVYHYKPAAGGSLRPYDPANPPSDVATTTTDEGHEVPFIVREETGVSLRDQYKIAALWDPAQGEWPDPTAENPGYADKLVLTHGQSCDTHYQMGEAPDVLLEDALAQGFAVASHALDHAGHNCNIVTQAESLIVTKEMVVERFGPIRYTIGSGCSGGSLVQQQVANAYPGVYQGLLPQCSFTDAWSSAQQYVDYVGLRMYLESEQAAAAGITPAQWPAIYGHPNPANAITFTEVIPNSGEPTRECPGVPAEDVYDENSNPDGVRCTFQDYMVNVFGVHESGPDAGKARRPIGNVGIQYGLSGLLDGTLTPDQFVALNRDAGGFDLDFNRIPERTKADPIAQERVYRSGAVNTGAHLDEVAIIDLGGPEPGAFHDVYRKYSMRDRLIREHGTAENQVFWEGQTPLLGDPSFVDDAIRAMDEWLAAVEADTREVPVAQKIIDAKQTAGIAERCVGANGVDVPLEVCDGTVDTTIFSSPRIEAGGGADAVGFTDDRLECQTMPLEEFDYAGTSFTEMFTPEQQETLRAVYPTGVCDYTKPGIGFQDATPWLTYQDEQGNVIYGGTPMGPEPVSVPLGAGASPCVGAPAAALDDRGQAREAHRPSIDCAVYLGIARGTSADAYSPLQPVTRDQIAAFLVRTLETAGVQLPAADTDAFSDVAGSAHRHAINRLGKAGIAQGDGGAYMPHETLDRDQMASLLVRAAEFARGAELAPSRTGYFTDVAFTSPHQRAISAGYERGLFAGTGNGTFSPDAVVLRDQMATFLVNLLEFAN